MFLKRVNKILLLNIKIDICILCPPFHEAREKEEEDHSWIFIDYLRIPPFNHLFLKYMKSTNCRFIINFHDENIERVIRRHFKQESQFICLGRKGGRGKFNSTVAQNEKRQRSEVLLFSAFALFFPFRHL